MFTYPLTEPMRRFVEELKQRRQRKQAAAAKNRAIDCMELEDRILLSATPMAAEALVNQATADIQQTAQSSQSVAANTQGDHVVVWSGQNQEGSWDVYARRVNAAGEAQGDAFQVSAESARDQQDAHVAMNEDGGFVVTWTDSDPETAGSADVYARLFDKDGAARGDAFLVNGHKADGQIYTANDQMYSSAAMADNGAFVVVWSSQNQDGSGWGVFGQRYDASGNRLGAEFQVNTYTASDQMKAQVAADMNGNFTVAWQSLHQDGDGWGIYARCYDVYGVPLGNEISVNTAWQGDQQNVGLGMFRYGTYFVVSWTSDAGSGTGKDVYARFFDTAGGAYTDQVRLNTTTAGDQNYSSVDIADNYDVIATWSSYNQDAPGTWGVYTQRYGWNLSPVSQEYLVNTTTEGSQSTSSLALINNLDRVIAWNGQGVGDDRGVFESALHSGLWGEYANDRTLGTPQFADADIGGPGRAGSASFDGMTWTVVGGGSGIGGTSDKFNFDSQDFADNGALYAQIASISDQNGQAGLMFRNDNDANAAFAAVMLQGDAVSFQWRDTDGGEAGSTTVSGLSGPLWLKLVRDGNTVWGYYGYDGINWFQIGEARTVTLAPTIKAGLAVSARNDAALCTAAFRDVTMVNQRNFVLNSTNIGGDEVDGSTEYDEGTYTVTANGNDLYGTSDQFRYASAGFVGDGEIVARVNSFDATDGWAMAGAMFRDGLDPESAFVMVGTAPNGDIYLQWRDAEGGGVSDRWGGNYGGNPTWVKIVRTGDEFRGYCSQDGQTWTQIGCDESNPDFHLTVDMGDASQAGLAVSSNDMDNPGTATFSNVAVSRTVNIDWSSTDIGAPGQNGSVYYSQGDSYIVSGGGNDLYSNYDQFNFVSQDFTGDGEIVARIDSIDDTDPWAVGGVMFRESDAPGARYAVVAATPGSGVMFQWRTDTDASIGDNYCTAAYQSGWSFSSPVWVKLVRSGDQFTAFYSFDGSAWTRLGDTQTIAMQDNVKAGLAVAAADNNDLCTVAFNEVAVTRSSDFNWSGDNLGADWEGSFWEGTGNTYVVSGGGADIGGQSDQFHYSYNNHAGDGTIVAHVALPDGADPAAKAGVMFRDGTAADSAFADVVRTADGVSFQWRSAAGEEASAVTVSGVTGDVWLKLVRVGNTFSGYYSTNGTAWTQIGSARTIIMENAVHVGLAVTSHNDGSLCAATFDDVRVAQTAEINFDSDDVGSPTLTGSSWYSNGDSCTVSGSGTNIGGQADQFYFASNDHAGDGTIAVQVASLDGANPEAEAGVMFRDGNAADALFAAVTVASDGQITFACRDSVGGSASETTVSGVTGPVWVKLTRCEDEFRGYYSTDGTTWVQIGAPQFIAMGDAVQLGLAVCSHDETALTTATFDNISVAYAADMNLDSADVGSPTMEGSAWYNTGTTHVVSGGGANIGGQADQFHFSSNSHTGDGTVTAKVASFSAADDGAEAGVMFRDGEGTGALFAAVVATPGEGVRFEWRDAVDGEAQNVTVAGISGPVWVKLVRTVNDFSGYYSTDGTTWTQIGTAQPIAMNQTVQAGLAVCAHNDAALATATFENVSVAQSAEIGFTSTDIDTGLAGSCTYENGVYTISGEGAGNQQMQYAWETNDGDVTMIARIDSFDEATTASRAGVMFRDGLDLDSNWIWVNRGQNDRVYLFWHNSSMAVDAVSSSYATTSTLPVWVKLVRSANSFAGYYSTDGTTWTQIGSSQRLAMSETIYTGLAVNSRLEGVLSTVEISNVSVEKKDDFTWSDVEVGAPSLAGSSTYPEGYYYLSGGGSTIDQFQFASRSVTGDVTLVARIDGQTNTASLSRGGLMLRDGSEADSKYVSICLTPGYGPTLTWRTTDSTSASATYTSGSIDAPVWLKLVRSGNNFSGYYSTDGVAWTQVGTTKTIAMSESVLGGLTEGARASGTLGNLRVRKFTLTQSSNFTWNGTDIGAPTQTGACTYPEGRYVVTGNGRDIWGWGYSDELHFASQEHTGDGEIIARVDSMTDTDDYCRAGLMFRDDLDPNAPIAMVFVTPDQGLSFQWRSGDNGGDTVSAYIPQSAPVWLKLTRVSNDFSAYYSLDGIAWTQIGATATVAMNGTARAGLIVTSRSLDNPDLLCSGTFSNVSISQTSDFAWTDADIGAPQQAGGTAYPEEHLTVTGPGFDIGGDYDRGYFVSEEISGDASMIVKVNSITEVVTWTKAGIMFRDSLDPDSKHVMLFATPESGVCLQWRTSDGQWFDYQYADIDTPVWLKLTRTENDFAGYYSTDGVNWTQVGPTITMAMDQTADMGLAVTSGDGYLAATGVFSDVSMTQTTGLNLTAADIGNPGRAGSCTTPEAHYVVTGGGSDIWDWEDHFQYASQTASGDLTMITRVDSIDYTEEWAKAGIMFRDDLSSISRNAFTYINAEGKVMFQWRAGNECWSNASDGPILDGPVWLKLTRIGNDFSGYYSLDGVSWTQVGSTQTIAMSETIQAGLAVTAHNNGRICTADFSNVSLTEARPGGEEQLTELAFEQAVPNIDFNWGNEGSPGTGIGGCDWSVSWQGKFLAEYTGTVSFAAGGNEGVRLWINDTLVADGWYDHGFEYFYGSYNLVEGQWYSVRMDYNQAWGDEAAQLWWTCPGQGWEIIPYHNFSYDNVAPVNQLPNSQTVSAGSPLIFSAATGNALTVTDLDACYGPMEVTLSVDYGTLALAQTEGLVIADAGGDSSLTIIGELADINAALDGLVYTPEADFEGAVALQITTCDLAPEFTGGPKTDSDTLSITVSGPGFMGTYFSGADFSGTMVQRVDAAIDFDWHGASPAQDIPGTNWSARWTGMIKADYSETYTFNVTLDGGCQLWVNDVLLIDNLNGSGGQFSGSIDLEVGQWYALRMDYRPGAAGGNVDLRWSSPSLPLETIPADHVHHEDSAPVNNVPADQTAYLNAPLVFSSATGNAITISDADAYSNPIQVTLTVDQMLVARSNFEGTYLGPDGWDASVNGGSHDGWNFDTLAYTANPETGAMMYTGSGIARNGSGYTFNNQAAPEGAQVAFIQGYGAMWQDVDFAESGEFVLSLLAANRTYEPWGIQPNTIQVQIDGVAVGTIDPYSSEYKSYATDSFWVSAGTHRVTLVGLATSGDRTTLIDSVTIAKAKAPGTLTLASTAGLTFLSGDGAGDATMTFSGMVADVNAALDGLWYLPGFDSVGTVNLQIFTSDMMPQFTGGPRTDSDTIGIDIDVPTDRSGLWATYFPGSWWTGAPVFRIDPTINFDWGNQETPADGIPGTNWSVIWRGQVLAETAGDYTFYITGNDGVKLFLNGDCRIDQWHDQSTPTTYQTTVHLNEGWNDIQVEYYQAAGESMVQLEWSYDGQERQVVPTDHLSCAAVLDYANTSPVNNVPGGQSTSLNTPLVFSAANGNAISIADAQSHYYEPLRVTLTAVGGTLSLGHTDWVTITQGDSVNDSAIILTGWAGDINNALDGLQFIPTANYTGAASVQITTSDLGSPIVGGPETDTDAVAVNVVAPSMSDFSGLLATYYNEMDFTGTSVQRVDPTVDFNWNNENMPASGIDGTWWSARWEGKVTPEFSETYTFYVTADDGVRLWVNDQLLCDGWYCQGATEYSGTIALEAGQSYSIRMEYFQGGGGQSAVLEWSSDSQAREVIPGDRLSHENTAPVNVVPSQQTTDENTPLVFSAANGNAIVVTDVDEFSGLVQVMLAVDRVPIVNSSFESPNIGTGSGEYRYNPSDAGWTFMEQSWNSTTSYSGSGVAGNGSAFNNPNALDGDQVAFIQGNGVMWQDVVFAEDGSYTLSFLAAYRDFYDGPNTIAVQVDGVTVGTFTPDSLNLQDYSTDAFSVAAGVHRISFCGLNPGGDRTTFVDQVAIEKAGVSASRGMLTLSRTAGLTFSEGDGTNDAAMIFTGTLDDINAALDGLTFTPAFSETGEYISQANITIITNDLAPTLTGGAKFGAAEVPIVVTPPWEYNGLLATYYTDWDFASSHFAGTGDDVGSPTLAGSFEITSENTYVVSGSGWDIWGSTDQFQFVHEEVDGNVAMITRVTSMTDTNEFARAGLMFRDTMDPDSPFAMVYLTPDHGVSFQFRSTEGGGDNVYSYVPAEAPVWLKLMRSDNVFSAYYSLDGSNWTQIGGFQGISMNENIQAGLIVTSRNTGALCTATFDHVAYVPNTTVQRVDRTLEFWHDNPEAPAPGIGYDYWDARWLGTITPEYSETYTFYATVDDACKIWVDGELVLDQPSFPGQTVSFTMDLIAGQAYSFRMDFHEDIYGAHNVLEWSSASQAREVIPASAFRVADQTPIFSVPGQQSGIGYQPIVFSENTDNAIGVYELHNDGRPITVTLSVTQGTLTLGGLDGLTFADGDGADDTTMTFTGTLDAVNAALNGLCYMRTAGDPGAATLTLAAADLGASGGARSSTAMVQIGSVQTSSPGLLASFYSDTWLGTPVCTRIDPNINYNWSTGSSPAAGVGSSNWSASWRGLIEAPETGTYTFYATADDGVRLWVDGQLLIDAWYPQSATTYAATINLTAGQQYAFRLDYNQYGVYQRVNLEWSGPNLAREVVPASQFSHFNQPPINYLPAAASVVENASVTFSSASGNAISINDPDTPFNAMQITLTAEHGTFSLGGMEGLEFAAGNGLNDASATFTGTIDAINAALDGLVFTPNADYSGPASLRIITTNLGTEMTTNSLLHIAVQAVNTAPELEVPASQSVLEHETLTFSENGGNALRIGDPDLIGLQTSVPLVNDSFEAVDVSAEPYAFQYAPNVPGWTFTSNSGIAAYPSGFGNPDAPDGGQTALLQCSGTIWQDVTFAEAGSYVISFEAAARNVANGVNPFVVEVDGVVVGTFTPGTYTFQGYRTNAFTVAAGPHRITFRGLNPGGDRTSFIDRIAIDKAEALVQVTLSVDHGLLSLGNTCGLTFSQGDGANDAAIILTGTVDDINTALDGLRYTPTGCYDGTDVLRITTNDLGHTGAGGPKSTTAMVAIQVVAVNEPPQITQVSPQGTYAGHPIVFGYTGKNLIRISDADAGSNPVQVTLAADHGALTLKSIDGLTFSAGDGAGDATMTFSGTLSAVNLALDGLSYVSDSDFVGTDTLRIIADDLGYSGAGGAQTATRTVTVSVAGGPVVNSTIAGIQQTFPQSPQAVAADAAGNYVIVWSSENQDGSGWGIYYRLFNAAGNAQGPEYRANSATSNDQMYATVAMSADGNFVITWSSRNQDGDGWGVYGQRFNAAGDPEGTEFRVNSSTDSNQMYSSVALSDTGGFLITWSSQNQDGGGWDIYGKLYDASGQPVERYDALGNPLGTEFLINTVTESDQLYSRAAMDADGNFVIVWQSLNQDGDGWGIYGQRYDASGNARGDEFEINTATDGDQQNVNVAMNDSGGFVVSWTSGGQDGSGQGIFARRYNADGTPAGAEFQVNSTAAGDQDYSSVAVDRRGNFLITWSSYGQATPGAWSVYSQRYAADGTSIGPETRINTTTDGSQAYSSVAALSPQDYVIVWSGSAPGETAGVFYAEQSPPGLLASYFNNMDLTGTPVQRIDSAINFTWGTEWGNEQSPVVGIDADEWSVRWEGKIQAQTTETYTFYATVDDGVRLWINDELIIDAWRLGYEETFTGSISLTAGQWYSFKMEYFQHQGPDSAKLEWSTATIARQVIPAAQFTYDNPAPVHTLPGTQTTNEDASLVFSTAGGNALHISDLDTDVVEVSLSVNHGALSLGSTAGLTLLAGDGVGDTTVVFSGSLDNVNAALNGLLFAPASHYYGTATLTISTNDLGSTGAGGPQITTSTLAIDVIPVNNAPAISLFGHQEGEEYEKPIFAVYEHQALIFSNADDYSILIGDIDAGNHPVQVSLTTDHGWLSLSSMSGLTFVAGDGSGDAAMTILGTIDNINAALDGLQFAPEDNYDGLATLQIAVDDLGNVGAGGPLNAADSISIAVTAVNDAPVNILPGADSAFTQYPKIFSTISVTDPDAGNNPVQVTLSVDHGVLSLSRFEGLTFFTGDGTDDAEITILGTINDINAALEGLQFKADDHFEGTARLRITTDDQGYDGFGGPQSDTDVMMLNVVRANEPPVNTVPGEQSVIEHETLIFSTGRGNALRVGDPDAGDLSIQVTLEVDHGTLSLNGIDGLTLLAGSGENDSAVTMVGKISSINAALNGLQFRPEDNYDGIATLRILSDDLGNSGVQGPLGSTDADAVAIRVTAVNDAPDGVLPGQQAVYEHQAVVFSQAHGNAVRVGDPDAGDRPIQISLAVDHGVLTLNGVAGLTFLSGDGANDAAMTFTGTIADINAALEGMIFHPVDNYNGVAGLQVAINDLGGDGEQGIGGAGTFSGVAPIRVTAVNDSPTVTFPQFTAPAPAELTFSTAGGNPITVSDPDAGNSPLLVTIMARDGHFNLADTAGLSIVGGTPLQSTFIIVYGNLEAVNQALDGLQLTSSSPNAALQIIVNDQGDLGGQGVGGAQQAVETLYLQRSYDPNFSPSDGSGFQILQGAFTKPNADLTPNDILPEVQDRAKPLLDSDQVNALLLMPKEVQNMNLHHIDVGPQAQTSVHGVERGKEYLTQELPEARNVKALEDGQYLASLQTSTDPLPQDSDLRWDDSILVGIGVVSAGYLAWALNGGSLLAGALSATPMWKPFDPLAVLESTGRGVKGMTPLDGESALGGEENLQALLS